MPGPNFFLLPSQNNNPLQNGIIVFEAGLNAQKAKAIDPDHYQGEEPRLYFQQAAEYFRQTLHEQTDNQVLALAHGYLSLIRFDGLDGQKKQPDITENMLHACEAINALAKTDKGLADIPQDFQNNFLAMINRLYRLYYQYKDREKWCGRFSAQISEYRQQQEAIVGIDSFGKANEYRRQKIKDINTVKETFTLLQQYMPVAESTESATSAPSPVRVNS